MPHVSALPPGEQKVWVCASRRCGWRLPKQNFFQNKINHAHWNSLENIEKNKVGKRKPWFDCVKPTSPVFNLRATMASDSREGNKTFNKTSLIDCTMRRCSATVGPSFHVSLWPYSSKATIYIYIYIGYTHKYPWDRTFSFST